MNKVKFNPTSEILSQDFDGMQTFIELALKETVMDLLLGESGAVTGLEVTAQPMPDMSVYVKPGRIYQAGAQGDEKEPSIALPILVAPNEGKRIDRVCAKISIIEDMAQTRNVIDVTTRQISQQVFKTRIHSGVTYLVVSGTSGQVPAPPAIPDGYISLAQVVVNAKVANIQQTDIADERPTISRLLGHTHRGGLDGAQISYRALKANLEASGIPDARLVDRPVADSIIPNGNTASLSTLLSNLSAMLRQITGKANWRTAPAKSIEQMLAMFAPSGFGIGGAYKDLGNAEDLNTIHNGGLYYIHNNNPNRPEDWCPMLVIGNGGTLGNVTVQLAINGISGKVWVRTWSAATWSAWKTVSDADTVDGKHAADFLSTPAAGFRMTYGSVAPASPQNGKELWVDTTNKVIKIYEGSAWLVIGAAYSA